MGFLAEASSFSLKGVGTVAAGITFVSGETDALISSVGITRVLAGSSGSVQESEGIISLITSEGITLVSPETSPFCVDSSITFRIWAEGITLVSCSIAATAEFTASVEKTWVSQVRDSVFALIPGV